jgi:hypothetical protein
VQYPGLPAGVQPGEEPPLRGGFGDFTLTFLEWAAAGDCGKDVICGAPDFLGGLAARGTTTVIGRTQDVGNLAKGERSLLDRLTPDLGSPKVNWARNSGVLREEMRRGLPIRDASPGDTAGIFLNAERALLKDRGWTFDAQTGYWMPPPP